MTPPRRYTGRNRDNRHLVLEVLVGVGALLFLFVAFEAFAATLFAAIAP